MKRRSSPVSPILSTPSRRSASSAMGPVDAALPPDLREVPHPLEEPVGDPGRSPGAPGDLPRAFLVDRHGQDGGRAPDHLAELLLGVEIEGAEDPEPVPQGCGEKAGPRGGAHQRERLEPVAVAPGVGALVEDEVDTEVLHGGGRGTPPRRGAAGGSRRGRGRPPLSRWVRMLMRSPPFFDGRPGRGDDVCPHLEGDDVGQRRLAQAGRAVEEDVIEGLAALPGGLDGDLQGFDHLPLADVVGQPPGPQVDELPDFALLRRFLVRQGGTRLRVDHFIAAALLHIVPVSVIRVREKAKGNTVASDR